MTWNERFTLVFNKKNALRVTIFTEDKRIKQKIVVVKNKTFNILDKTYIIESEKVFYYKGLPFLAYRENSPEAIDPNNLKASEITAEEYYASIDQNIVLQIMRYATKGDQKLINMILIGAGSTIMVLGVGLYLLYTKIQELQIQNLQLLELIETIQRLISNSAGGF